MRFRPFIACFAVSMIALAGCIETGSSIDPELLAKHRSEFLLAEEPEGAMAVLDVREMFTGDADEDLESHMATEVDDEEGELEFTAEDVATDEEAVTPKLTGPQDVVVVGKIGGMPNPWAEEETAYPWKENSATFFIVDPATASEFGDTEHDVHCDCPFCARKTTDNIDSIAVVSFVSGSGEAIPFSANELLGLENKDMVVVRGKARLAGGRMLIISADGIYVRR